MGLALAAPGIAHAYIGESLVVNPTTKEVTGPAKTIITKPTFLPETVTEAGSVLGVNEAGAAAGVFESGLVLPSLGAVLAFGAGAAVGSEICSVIGISGCWFHGSVSADPAVSEGKWEYRTTVLTKGIWVEGGPAWTWYWHQNGFSVETPLSYKGLNGTTCGIASPAGYTGYVVREIGGACGSEGNTKKGFPTRSAMQNRVLEYHATDNPAIGNVAYTAPETWPKKLGEALTAPTAGSAADHVGQHIASQLEPSIKDPYAVYVTVPACDELPWKTCRDDLEELELEPARESLTWEDADLDLKPEEVFELVPDAGTELKVGTKVIVKTNPDEKDMPLVIPQPESDETYSHYAARLNPSLEPERHILEAAFIDPSVGPNGVVSVSPEPETRLDPASKHKVEVTTNPADAPAAAPAWAPPPIEGINMDPLTGMGSPCTVFPFGLFCWVGGALAQFNTEGVCPKATVPVSFNGDDSDFELSICGDAAEQIMGYVRPLLLMVFIVGCGFTFARATQAVGPD